MSSISSIKSEENIETVAQNLSIQSKYCDIFSMHAFHSYLLEESRARTETE